MKRRYICGVIMVALLFTGCGSKTDEVVVTQSEEVATSENKIISEEVPAADIVENEVNAKPEVCINGQPIKIGDNIADYKERIGNPDNLQVSASCLNAGDDKIITYNGIHLYTNPEGANDIVYLIELENEASLPSGIKIGSSLTEVKDVYGDECSDDGEYISYDIDGIALSFEIIEDKVSFVEIYKN